MLHASFLSRPLAHRGLHDRTKAVIENSRTAFRAAIAAGYGIELDVQCSADGRAMVFHDDALDRLTERKGPLRAQSACALAKIFLAGTEDRIMTLEEVLADIAGQSPVLIEMKDQTGSLGPTPSPMEQDVARVLRDYGGPVAVMSFNPHSVQAMQDLLPGVARGLTTCDFNAADWPGVAASARADLAQMTMLPRVGATFISHDRRDLASPAVTAARGLGCAILCWTVRTAEEERVARIHADNITFEAYPA